MKKAPNFIPPAKVAVTVHRNGAELHAEVAWSETQLVLQSFLDVFRAATKLYPELIVELPHVGGSSVEYVDDFSGEGRTRRKIGF